uniref:Uncharacterized protein n=1 Tax=Nelumbo nucifera TaxID=4432 RepID=A0A822YHS7_NELNU|nr:TPA_asm: hypothetical protein HUJ06_010534 [Nelumbo nucifera]
MASQKGRAWRVFTTVPASRTLDPDEIAACIRHKEEALRWGSDPEIDEILAGARRCAGDNGSLEGSTVAQGREKNRETLRVQRENLCWGNKRVSVKQS